MNICGYASTFFLNDVCVCLLLLLKVREMHASTNIRILRWCSLNHQKNSERAVSGVLGSFAYVRAKVLNWNTELDKSDFNAHAFITN